MKFLPMKLLKKNKSVTPIGKKHNTQHPAFFPPDNPKRKEKEMTLRKISTFDVERVEDPTHELRDINEVVILKVKIIELQNALNGKNQILHSKLNEVLELKETVRFLRGDLKYYFEEINRLDAFRASQDIRIPKHYQDGM